MIGVNCIVACLTRCWSPRTLVSLLLVKARFLCALVMAVSSKSSQAVECFGSLGVALCSAATSSVLKAKSRTWDL